MTTINTQTANTDTIINLPNNDIVKVRSGHGDTPECFQLDLNAVGRRGNCRILVQPKGYWSCDVIALRIERHVEWNFKSGAESEKAVEWKFEMNHSSGARLGDTNKDGSVCEWGVDDDLVAEENFAIAMRSVIAIGREIRDNFIPLLENAYQEHRSALEAKQEEERIAKQAKVDADAPLGLPKAKALTAEVRAMLTTYNSEAHIHLFGRGNEEAAINAISAVKNIALTWYFHGDRISEKEVIKMLAESSHRTCIADKEV